jgi:hypothetical protein
VPHAYDNELMKRGEAARRLITEGEDPFATLLSAVWPDHDWSESALYARLTSCPRCRGADTRCGECGNTGLVTAARNKLLAIEEFASAVFAEQRDAPSSLESDAH